MFGGRRSPAPDRARFASNAPLFSPLTPPAFGAPLKSSSHRGRPPEDGDSFRSSSQLFSEDRCGCSADGPNGLLAKDRRPRYRDPCPGTSPTLNDHLGCFDSLLRKPLRDPHSHERLIWNTLPLCDQLGTLDLLRLQSERDGFLLSRTFSDSTS